VRLLAEQLLHHLLDLRHAGHAADQHHLVDVGGGQAGVLQRALHRPDRALDEVIDQLLEFRAAELQRQVFRARGIGGDVGEVDLGLLRGGQLDLGLFGGFLEPLEGQSVLAQVDALLLLELVGQVIDEAHVEILAAEEGVAVGRLHLEYAIADLQDGDVEGAAAEVVDGDGLAVVLVHSVGQGGSRRLVDDAQHFQAGDPAGVLGGLALGVIEIGGTVMTAFSTFSPR
jgi:hypothetical protein